MFAEKAVTARECMSARKPIEARIKEAQRRLARATRAEALAGLPGNGDSLRAQWAGLTFARQCAIVAAILDHAVIGPGTLGARALDPACVQPLWQI